LSPFKSNASSHPDRASVGPRAPAARPQLSRRYEFKTIETEDFRRLCAEFMPPGSIDAKLENFFDQWVYGTGERECGGG
jgi:hypothetical protein